MSYQEAIAAYTTAKRQVELALCGCYTTPCERGTHGGQLPVAPVQVHRQQGHREALGAALIQEQIAYGHVMECYKNAKGIELGQ